MTLLLLLLAIPLLAAPFLAPRRSGATAAQLLLTGFALAALWQGAATLNPAELRDIALQSTGDAWFVGISLGVLLVAGVLLPAVFQPWQLVIGVPLLAGVWFATTASMAVPLLIGAVVAIVPVALAWAVPVGRDLVLRREEVMPQPPGQWTFALVSAISMLFLPLAIAVVVLLAFGWWRVGRPARWWPIIATAAATALLVAWCWSALTVAGAPWITLAAFARDAPVSPAASQLLAALSLGGVLLLLRPWPFVRTVPTPDVLVVIALAFHFVGTAASTSGTLHWQPIVSMAMLAVFVVAVLRREWDHAAVALLVLAATRPGALAVTAALAAALAPALRRRVADRRVCAVLGGVVLAVVTGVVARDQVVIGVVLALVATAAAYRFDRRVAAVAGSAHL